eukprot:g7653.t1
MAKGRKRPASAIEEDRSPPQQPNGNAITATGGDDGGSKAINGNGNVNSNNEIKFGKHLASSDKRVRDRTVAALREWLRQRSRGGRLTDLDLLKIWRGLWYCMFMCDKAPVQRELAENLAGLLSLFKDDRPEGVRFFKSFCVTMQRDWERIDNLRIDKYYTLVRVFVREALAFCRLPAKAPSPAAPRPKKKKTKKSNNNDEEEREGASAGGGGSAEWDLGLVGAMSGVMEEEVLALYPAPIGLRLHLADVWAEEACKAGGEDMPTEAFLVALAPWLRVAAHPETNAVVFKRTCEEIFEGLLQYFPEEKEEEDEMEQEGEDGDGQEQEEKMMFKTVELDTVQACLFEVAGAPQTREKRRVKLYELHRRYQKRTGVAPNAGAPPSGILPLPEDSEPDSDDEGDEGEYDGEYVEAGARPRAVRGPEPAVPGWVAAGIAAGAISEGKGDGGEAAKKRRKRSGSLEESEEEAVSAEGDEGAGKRKSKKRKTGKGAVEEVEGGRVVAEEKEEEEGGSSAKKKKITKKSRSSIDDDDDEAAAAAAAAATAAEAEAEAAATVPEGKKSKKRKKDEASLVDDADDASAAEGRAAANGVQLQSPPSSGKRKNKKKRRDSSEEGESAAAAAAAAATAAATTAASEADAAAVTAPAAEDAEATTPPSSGKKKKKQKKSKSNDAEEEGVATLEANAENVDPDSSSDKKKKKKKRSSVEGAASSPASPAADTSATDESMPPPPQGSFRTPPKKGAKAAGGGSSGKKKKKSPGTAGTVESAKKTVTFGTNMEKEHVASVKDLKTRVITPAKDAGTPQKGLLKVGGGGGSAVKPLKPAAGRKDTPYVSKKKKASDFF